MKPLTSVTAAIAWVLFSCAAFGADPLSKNEPCPGLFARIGGHLKDVPPNPEGYLKLRNAPVSRYFPETQQIEVQPTVKVLGAKLTDDTLKRFRADFDALLEERARTFGLPAKDFRAWLKAKSKTGEPYPELDPLYIEQAFKASGATLEDLQNAYFLAFAKEKHGPGLASFLKRLNPRELGSLSLSLLKGVGRQGKAIVAGALIAGPVATTLNFLLIAPMKPIQESSEQLSNIVFKDVSQAIQSGVSKQMKKLQGPVSDLQTTTMEFDQYDFSKLDRKEAKRIMDEFEARYYRIFLRMSGYMPTYKRVGRDVIRDWLLIQPMLFASSASTFETQYTLNQSLLAAVEDRIRSRGAAATEEEKALVRQHKDAMETAENRLAMTLASWKLFTLAFAEVSRESQDANAILVGTLERYEKSMNLDKYRKELSGKIREAFHNFDPSFTGLEKLEQRRD